MYAQTAVKRNSIPRNGAYRIVNRDVHFCTPPCSSLRSKNYTSLGRITLDTAIDPPYNTGHENYLACFPRVTKKAGKTTDAMTLEMYIENGVRFLG